MTTDDPIDDGSAEPIPDADLAPDDPASLVGLAPAEPGPNIPAAGAAMPAAVPTDEDLDPEAETAAGTEPNP